MTRRHRLSRWLARLPLLILAVVALVLMARTERFLTDRTLASILALASIVGVLAIGQAFVLIGGGFDLSQGAMLGLTAAVTAWMAKEGLGLVPASLAALAIGTLLGTINGLFVAGVGTNPFVTTLSTQLVFRGATFVFLGGRPISGVKTFTPFDRTVLLGHTPLSLRGFLFLGLSVVAWVVLRQTVFGQHVYAVGGNAEAARLAGVRTRPIRVATFALAGLSAGIAALLWLAWLRLAKPDTGVGYELGSIAACVVGGVSLQGGMGSVPGAAAGCLLLETLGTLITMNRGFPDEYRALVTGAVILIFAAADALARRSEPR
jgi:ribose transport system permease protein